MCQVGGVVNAKRGRGRPPLRLHGYHGANREFRKMIAQGRHVTPSIESNPLTACTRIGILRFLQAAEGSKKSNIYREIQSLTLPSYKVEMHKNVANHEFACPRVRLACGRLSTACSGSRVVRSLCARKLPADCPDDELSSRALASPWVTTRPTSHRSLHPSRAPHCRVPRGRGGLERLDGLRRLGARLSAVFDRLRRAGEEAARGAGLGLWRGEFIPPWRCVRAPRGGRPKMRHQGQHPERRGAHL